MTYRALLPTGLQYLAALKERGCGVSDTAEGILGFYNSPGLREFRPYCLPLTAIGLEERAYHTYASVVAAAFAHGYGFSLADVGLALALFSVDHSEEMHALLRECGSLVLLMRPIRFGGYDYVFEVVWDGAQVWLSTLGWPTQRTYFASQHFVFA